MKESSLDVLCEELTLEFQRDRKGPRVASLLSRYAVTDPSWRRFALFDETCYTRNLVFKDGMYELLVLCWGVGQESPIHNHMGQNCWMAVLDGRIEEIQFTEQPDGRPGPLIQTCIRTFGRGEVAFISDAIALHLVRPVTGTSGVSFHLYSRPYDLCMVYDRATGTVSEKQLAYHSTYGERCAPARPPHAGARAASRRPDLQRPT